MQVQAVVYMRVRVEDSILVLVGVFILDRAEACIRDLGEGYTLVQVAVCIQDQVAAFTMDPRPRMDIEAPGVPASPEHLV